jgi:hypothetical protein
MEKNALLGKLAEELDLQAVQLPTPIMRRSTRMR